MVATRNAVPEESLKEQMLYLEEKYKGNFIQLHTPNLEISSQTLRDWIRQGKSVRYYLVDEVYTYIREEGIYGHSPGFLSWKLQKMRNAGGMLWKNRSSI